MPHLPSHTHILEADQSALDPRQTFSGCPRRATTVRAYLGDDKTSRNELTKTSAAHRNPPWQTSSWEEMSGPMRKWTRWSNSLKQHNAREMGRQLVARAASLRLRSDTTMLRFHRVGTTLQDRTRLNKLSKARCHQGNGTLNKEYGTPSTPIAESTQIPRAPRNSEE